MNKRLHILYLEDEADFVEMVHSLLTQDGLDADVKLVNNLADFEKALDTNTFDVILSDYRLSSFTGLDALAIVKKRYPHTPFILVSGTIGEQAAIESLKAGATDYVLKHHPDRLPTAILRAVQEAEARAQRRQMETELVRRERYFRALTENSLDILSILNRDGMVIYKSPSVKSVLGYDAKELVGQSAFAHVHPDDLAHVLGAFQAGLAEPERTFTLQCRYRRKDGSWRYLEGIGQNRLSEPEIAGVVINWRDVTDRRNVEQELRDSEKHYRLLFHSNPNPMWVFDLETLAFLEVNEAAIQHYGFSRDEFLAMKITDIRPGEDEERQSVSIPGTDRGRIWRHRRRDGSLIEVEVVWSPMAFRDRFAALTMATDVTERRRIEHRNAVFSRLGHNLSAATTASEAAMIICKAADELFKWDGFALDLYAAEKDEVFSLLNISTVEGRRVELPSSVQPKTASAIIKRVIGKGAELISKNEDKRHNDTVMLAPVRKGDAVIGVLFIQSQLPGAYTSRDLETLQVLADHCGGALERVHAEQSLRESQRRFRDLFENSPDAIFVQDLNGRVLDLNAAACELHGVKHDELVGKNALEDLVPPARREEAQRDFRKLAEGKLSRIESESLRADGRAVPVEIRASLIEYDGKPALLLHKRDVTERRAAEAALRSSETLFRSVWENSVDGMRLTDEHGIIVAVNDAFCKLAEMSQEELEGKPFMVIYAQSEDREDMLEKHRERFREHIPQREQELRATLHNGREVILEINDSFVELRGQPLLALSLFRDVTTQKRLEEQLRQAQKMEAIGQLAGGVAHDFNNILTIIHGHAALLQSGGNLSELASKSAQQIVQAAERAAGLTRQLLTFSRRQVLQPRRLDMNKVVGDMTNMLGRLLGEDITLHLNYSQRPCLVDVDASMMEQVLLNLAVNARDAMPKGGQLTIRIAVVEIGELHVWRHPEARVGRFVCLIITDTGCGIPPENLPRIFEPFFTTKEVGKGTGLGLATVYGIVKQHQGWIEVESRIDLGSTFRVYIHCTTQEAAGPEKPTAPVTVRGGTETILVVEDEQPVRELVARILQRHGYKILQAGTGNEALGVWQDYRDEIALLLTDLVMPDGMNGRELAEKLWTERPELKVIFTSGYSAEVVGKDFILEPEVNFLQKPYHPQILALTVRKCLDKPQA
jgi:PAS domain S-box-containing protein